MMVTMPMDWKLRPSRQSTDLLRNVLSDLKRELKAVTGDVASWTKEASDLLRTTSQDFVNYHGGVKDDTTNVFD